MTMKPTVAERLAAGGAADENGCLTWTRCVNSRGYSQISVGGRRLLGHRVAWELVNGPIPEGMTIDHLCCNKRCIAVAHMEIVPREVNSARGNREPANTPRCENGHGRVGGNSASVAPDCIPCARSGRVVPVDEYGVPLWKRRVAEALDRPSRAS